jgi:hypothetical protein
VGSYVRRSFACETENKIQDYIQMISRKENCEEEKKVKSAQDSFHCWPLLIARYLRV